MTPEDEDELFEGVTEDFAIEQTAKQLAHYSGRSEITAEERKIVASLWRIIFLDVNGAVKAAKIAKESATGWVAAAAMAVELAKKAKKNATGWVATAVEHRKLYNAKLKQLGGITQTNSKRRAAANADYQRYRAIAAVLGNGKLSLHQRALRVQAKLKERGERVACRTIERALRSKEV